LSPDSESEIAPPGGGTSRGVERAMIVKSLQDHGWNQTKAAEHLGISRDNLRYRVKKYQIKRRPV
jgi:two-component system response regulator HydG/two-component system response regulator AtoC